MRVLVTGADGLLGTNIVRYLLEKGHDVSVFLMKGSASTTLNGLNIQSFYGNILDTETMNDAFEGQDAVIHVAASTKIYPAKSEIVRKINIDGTKNVVAACEKFGLKKMVYIGSGSSVNSEKGVSGESYGLDYIQSKFEALQFIQDKAKTGFPVTSVLPTFMVGPYDFYAGSGKMILSVASGKLKFYTDGGRNFVHVRAVAAAAVHAIELGEVGKTYLASGENLMYKDFFSIVAKVAGVPAPKMQIPSFLVLIAGRVGQFFQDLLKKEMLLNWPVARISCEKQFVDGKSAAQALNIPQIPVETAVQDCYTWFKENGYIQ